MICSRHIRLSWLAIGIVGVVALSSCSKKESGERSQQSDDVTSTVNVPDSSRNSLSMGVQVGKDSIDWELNRRVEEALRAAHHNARTVQEAYQEGLDNGREDGEEDGMNNDSESSYDDSCPYKGKMRRAYKRGYREGYDEGLEDGLEEYDVTKESWEEETDW